MLRILSSIMKYQIYRPWVGKEWNDHCSQYPNLKKINKTNFQKNTLAEGNKFQTMSRYKCTEAWIKLKLFNNLKIKDEAKYHAINWKKNSDRLWNLWSCDWKNQFQQMVLFIFRNFDTTLDVAYVVTISILQFHIMIPFEWHRTCSREKLHF